MNLPLFGEHYPSRQKRFRETIVFVHHFGGSKKTVLRQVRLVNEIGFDAVTFNLMHHDALFQGVRTWQDALAISPAGSFGLVHIWSEQISSVLDAVPGPKMVFSFSMPSNSALAAISSRDDVRALICDGGPFLQLVRCTWNLLEHQYRVRNRFARALLTAVSLPFYGRVRPAELFAGLPEGFPILSLRGELDPLVPESAIDAFFASGLNQVNLLSVVFHNSGHLDAVKNEPAKYREGVRTFLEAHATYD